MEHPEAPLYQCWTKAAAGEVDGVRRSFRWLTARRASFKVQRDRIECGDWNLPFSQISNAVLYRTRAWFVIPFNVLELSMQDGHSYQFGFNPWAHPEKRVPFDFEVRRVGLKMAPLSLVIRLIAFVYIARFLFQKWTH